MKEFRKLRADEIQVRPTDSKMKGHCLLLLYQDARCAMNILDETVGKFGWQKKYESINGNIYCGIAIKDTDTNEWIWKYDCGAFTAKEEDMQSKADASDATKRAAVCWGIGRELYNTPKIRINCPENYYMGDRLTMTFYVRTIEWDGDTLQQLVIVDRFGNKVYDFTEKNDSKSSESMTDKNKVLTDFCKKEANTLTEEEKTNLRAFYTFYKEKEWNGKFDAEKLWSIWKNRTR